MKQDSECLVTKWVSLEELKFKNKVFFFIIFVLFWLGIVSIFVMNHMRNIMIATINTTAISILRRCICHHVFFSSGTFSLTFMILTGIKCVIQMIFYKRLSECYPFLCGVIYKKPSLIIIHWRGWFHLCQYRFFLIIVLFSIA